MYGYKIKLPKSIPTVVWACKSTVNRYDWQNNHDENMIEFSICTAQRHTVTIGDREPISILGKSFSCIPGNVEIRNTAEDGVLVEIVSIAVRFDKITYQPQELDERDTKEKDILLVPAILSELPMQEWMMLEKLLYRIASEAVKKDAASEFLCVSLIYEIFAILDRMVRKELKTKRKRYSNYYVLKADAILSQRYEQKITLRSVAEELGITPNYLSYLYKNTKGIGFSERLCELRMKRAEALILEGKYSLADITEMVGLDDESHLRRRFRQYLGISIKEYRLLNREQTLYHEKPQRKD